MSNHEEITPNIIPRDPHFNRLMGLSSLSQEALRGVIEALGAKEHRGRAEEDVISANESTREALLSHYIQDPDTMLNQHSS